MQLVQNSNSKRFWADFMVLLAITMTFLASAVAVVATYVETVENRFTEMVLEKVGGDVFDIAVVVLPAMSGVITAVLAQGNITTKWAMTFLAENVVASEIFRFRTRAGDYTVAGNVASAHGDDTSAEEHVDNISTRMLDSRTRFANKLQKIVTRTADGDMKSSYMSVDDQGMCARRLHNHVNQTLGPSSSQVGSSSNQAAAVSNESARMSHFTANSDRGDVALLSVKAGVEHVHSQDIEAHTSVLSNERYFKMRVLPFLDICNASAPRLWWKMQMTTMVGLIFAALATVLGALGFKCCVPLAVSATTVVTSVQHHFKFKQRLEATTKAAADLSSLVVFWSCLGPVAQRMDSTKRRLVSTCEAASLGIAKSWAGDLAILPTDEETLDVNRGKDVAMQELTKVS